MKLRLLTAAYLLFFSTTSFSEVSVDSMLKIGTMDLRPYGWIEDTGKSKGILYTMHQEIGARYGKPFQNKILPFNRMLYALRTGKVDLISSQPHQAALEVGEKLAIQHKVKVIAVAKKGVDIHSIEDLKGKNLLYHNSASYSKLEGVPRYIERVNNYQKMIRMLASRACCDAAVFSEPAYYYWLSVLGYSTDDFGDVIVIEDDIEQWILVRKNLPSKDKAELKAIVDKMYHEKVYDKLVEQLIQQAKFPQL